MTAEPEDSRSRAVDAGLRAWSAGGDTVPPETIRVVLVDVDGVITPGEGQPVDLEVLARLQALNRTARTDRLVPAIAMCTGRQAAYVELMSQIAGCFVPSLFEHGAGLFIPGTFRYLFDNSLPARLTERLAELRAALRVSLVESGRAFIQPGKEATITLYPLGRTSVDEVASQAHEAVTRFGAPFAVVRNLTGVEILPAGTNKGSGLRWLAAELGIGIERFAGVGDADADLSFLALVGWSAAPSNATATVRNNVRYVASRPFGDGLLEILDRIVESNRARDSL